MSLTPLTFTLAVRKLSPLIEKECAVETCEAIARIVADRDKERVIRDDCMAIVCELFTILLAGRRTARRR